MSQNPKQEKGGDSERERERHTHTHTHTPTERRGQTDRQKGQTQR